MKGLVKDISSMAIAGFVLASGAITADAQVVTGKVNPSEDAQERVRVYKLQLRLCPQTSR